MIFDRAKSAEIMAEYEKTNADEIAAGAVALARMKSHGFDAQTVALFDAMKAIHDRKMQIYDSLQATRIDKT